MKYYFFFISLIFISCQEEITLDLPQAERKLVVEANIETDFPPYVILSRNQGYFESIDFDTYNNLFVDDAEVKVFVYENGIKKDSITLEKFDLIDSLPIIYTDVDWFENRITNNDKTPYLFSQEERTYFLEIKWNNQIITAETFIPKSTPLDCLWVEKNETDEEKDYKYDIRAIYSDPADKQNNILIKSRRTKHQQLNQEECKINDIPDFPLKLVDAGSDILINGETFETYFPRPNEKGFPTGKYNGTHIEECENDSTKELDKDIVLIKFCQIDEPSMKFWRGVVRQAGTNGNPFAEPMNLSSNINGGLGNFTGIGAVYYKVPIIEDNVIKNTFNDSLAAFDIF